MSVPRRLHRAQYIIGPKQVLLGPEWYCQKLGERLVLSYDAALRVQNAIDRRNRHWWLLGTAVESNPLCPTPIEAIKAFSGEDPIVLSDSWAGRWLLTDGVWLFPDASSLLSCHIVTTEDGIWATSSPQLALSLAGEENTKGSPVIAGKMNWFPPPYARCGAARRLLSSQSLRFSDGAIFPLRLKSLHPPTPSSYRDILDSLQTHLIAGVTRACEGAAEVHLPLSAGYDSRLMLAIAKAAGLKPRCFTFQKRNRPERTENHPTTSPALRSDMILPPQLAGLVDTLHQWVPIGSFSQEALNRFDQQCAGECLENDRFYESHGQWDWATEQAVVLRGGVFEVGRCFYWQRLPDHPLENKTDMQKSLLASFEIKLNSSHHTASLAEWCAWAAATPNATPVFDWRDRFYIEQRVGGWLARLEQALDLVPGTRFYAANSRAVFRLLTVIPVKLRATTQHHVDLIERMAPELLTLPFNPPDPIWYRLLRKTRFKTAQLLRMPPQAALRELIRLVQKYNYKPSE